jgi:hypothetical protein
MNKKLEQYYYINMRAYISIFGYDIKESESNVIVAQYT